MSDHTPLRRTLILAACVLLVAVIGYADSQQGNENSMLLFYMIPMGVATWYCGTIAGFLIVALSVLAGVMADRFAGIPRVSNWNVAMGASYYLLFVPLLSRWRNSVREIQTQVKERTSELQREMGARRQLEREMADIMERERGRLGREIHDNLCQHLTGSALKAQAVARQIERGEPCAGRNARSLVALLESSISLARDIAKGLFSPQLEGEGLVAALEGLAQGAFQEHQVDCQFEHSPRIDISSETATQLYWITREALSNAIRHGNPRHVHIRLTQAGQHVELDVEDDGGGMEPCLQDSGMGLDIMRQRAEMAGGSIEANEREEGGTSVRCVLPLVA